MKIKLYNNLKVYKISINDNYLVTPAKCRICDKDSDKDDIFTIQYCYNDRKHSIYLGQYCKDHLQEIFKINYDKEEDNNGKDKD